MLGKKGGGGEVMRSPFHSRGLPCYSGCKPKGPVFETTTSEEVAAPTYKRGFVTPQFLGLVRPRAWFLMVTGGMGISVRTATRLRTWFQHPTHLLRLKPQTVALATPEGAKTMPAVTQASRRAVPLMPTTGTTDPIQLHAEAHNALNMAVFYLRQPQANLPGARRKAVQALSALRNLSATLEG